MGKNYTAYNKMRKFQSNDSIRTIWGLAKSPELQLEEDELYTIVYRETGKDEMKKLVQSEISKVCNVLRNIKDDVKNKAKRTDEGGRNETAALRRKIYMLTCDLKWVDEPKRLEGFLRKMKLPERVEWLSRYQCNVVIEALKKMVEREKKGVNYECN